MSYNSYHTYGYPPDYSHIMNWDALEPAEDKAAAARRKNLAAQKLYRTRRKERELALENEVNRLQQNLSESKYDLERTNFDPQLTRLELARYAGQSFDSAANMTPLAIYGHSAPRPIVDPQSNSPRETWGFQSWDVGYAQSVGPPDPSYLWQSLDGQPVFPVGNKGKYIEGAPVRNSEPIPSTSAAATAFDDPTHKKKPLPTRAAYPGEECIVCADKPLLFPAKPPTARCSHEARVCTSCLQDHLTSEFSIKGAIYGFACPAPDCHEVLDYNEFKFWSSSTTFARYDRALMRQTMGLDGNFIMCTNAKCDAGQIHNEGANAPIVTCHVCHHRTCFTHQVTWHEGYTCEEWDKHQKARVGIATDEYLSRYTKNCPNCHKPIERYAGCDSLRCKPPAGCGHTFCWLCLAPYDAILRDGNHRHYPQCKHYAAWDDPSSKKKSGLSATTVTPYSAPAPSSSTVTPYTSSSASATVMASGSRLNAHRTLASTSISASNPPPSPPYTSYHIASTSHTGKKWYRFWKDR